MQVQPYVLASRLLCLACFAASPTGVLAADASQLLPIQEAQAADTAHAPPAEDGDALMRELCEGYADDEGVAADGRTAHVEACLESMTVELSNMQSRVPPVIDAAEDVNISLTAPSNPEALVANELVDKPLPGSEQLEATTPTEGTGGKPPE